MRELQRRAVEQLCVCPSGSPLFERLRAENLPVTSVKWGRGGDPRALLGIVRTIGRYDVVHAHDAHALQMTFLPARLVGRPLIAARRVIFRTRAALWNRATRVIAISDAVRRRLIASSVKEDIIRTVRSGIDLHELDSLPSPTPDLRERLGIPRSAFLAGTVGTLLEYKHQERIAEAAALTEDVTWVIVGDGPRRTFLEECIARNDVATRVRLAGSLADARAYIRAFNVFVFPSINEALGTSVLDAMALGVPVVAADSAGPAEVLGPVHERTGCSLFQPMDAGALAETVCRIRSTPALRAAMIQHQHERVRDFVIEKTADDTLAVYAEVVR
jgi:glycosyltransferase involved in cell wall biosynthesis